MYRVVCWESWTLHYSYITWYGSNRLGSERLYYPTKDHLIILKEKILLMPYVIDWRVYNCLTQLYGIRDRYIIYYIKTSYMFRPLSLAVFSLINEKLSNQVHSTCVGCIKVEVRGEVGTRVSYVLCRMGCVGTWVLLF